MVQTLKKNKAVPEEDISSMRRTQHEGNSVSDFADEWGNVERNAGGVWSRKQPLADSQ